MEVERRGLRRKVGRKENWRGNGGLRRKAGRK